MSDSRLTIVGDVDPRGLEAVTELLDSGHIDSAWYTGVAASTNTHALQELTSAAANCPGVRLVLADQQSAGRGRHGRSWISSNQTLTFSLVVPVPNDTTGLNLRSLAVGVGIGRVVDAIAGKAAALLKWPNDVYYDEGKLAGVLMETTASRPDRMVIGVGINVGTSPHLKGEYSAAPAIDLAKAAGRAIDRYDVFALLVHRVLSAIDQADRAADQIVSEFRTRCLLSGKVVSYRCGRQAFSGHCLGVGDDGMLRVVVDGVEQQLDSGEVRLVRRVDSC